MSYTSKNVYGNVQDTIKILDEGKLNKQKPA